MKYNKLAIGVVTILLAASMVGASAFTPQADRLTDPGSPELPDALLDWEQANSDGFGDPGELEVSALEAFNGYLYAGTYNPNPIDPAPFYDGARIYRSSNGSGWAAVTLPGFGNTHDTAPPAIHDLTVFKGYLYASTGRGNAAQIWRSVNGVNWGPVVNAGFGDPDIVDLTVMVEYDGWLYVGARKQDSQAQIWRTYTGDGNLSNWTQVAVGADPARVTGLAVFGGDLYAAVQSDTGAAAQIWRSFGGGSGSWTTEVSDGFGNPNTILTGGMAVFGGYLYVGAGNTASGARLFRTDGVDWTPVTTPISDDTNNQQVEMVFVFDAHLYVSAKNTASGIEIWRSADGATWEQVNLDGFSDGNNTGSNRSNATANFLGQLYVGTSNGATGGELWRTKFPITNIYLPLILRQP
jgi:hypothetical protein